MGVEDGEPDQDSETSQRPTDTESRLASGQLWVAYQEKDQCSFQQLQPTTRLDEETPWLRRTGFHIHLVGCHKLARISRMLST